MLKHRKGFQVLTWEDLAHKIDPEQDQWLVCPIHRKSMMPVFSVPYNGMLALSCVDCEGVAMFLAGVEGQQLPLRSKNLVPEDATHQLLVACHGEGVATKVNVGSKSVEFICREEHVVWSWRVSTLAEIKDWARRRHGP